MKNEQEHINTLIQAWVPTPLLTYRKPESGTINQVWLVTTADGTFVLRQAGHNDYQRLQNEHDLINYVYHSGLPAIPPLQSRTGSTIVELDGHLFTLFPFAQGEQIDRSLLTANEASAMGLFLARLHYTLQDYPHDKVQKRTFSLNLTNTLQRINDLEIFIRQRPLLTTIDQQSLDYLTSKRSYVLSQSGQERLSDLQTLPQQVIHGDYQETNLFFQGRLVSGIIDWDQAYVASRAWEVLRTLHYAFHFKSELCLAFIEAYRSIDSLPLAMLDQAAMAYSAMRAHDTWLLDAIYFEGNIKLQKHLLAGFQPVIEQWQQVRSILKDK